MKIFLFVYLILLSTFYLLVRGNHNSKCKPCGLSGIHVLKYLKCIFWSKITAGRLALADQVCNNIINWKFWYKAGKDLELLFRKLLKIFSDTFLNFTIHLLKIQKLRNGGNGNTVSSEIFLDFHLSETEEHHVVMLPCKY